MKFEDMNTPPVAVGADEAGVGTEGTTRIHSDDCGPVGECCEVLLDRTGTRPLVILYCRNHLLGPLLVDIISEHESCQRESDTASVCDGMPTLLACVRGEDVGPVGRRPARLSVPREELEDPAHILSRATERCNCQSCLICHGLATVCGVCNMCTRCHTHDTNCPGCPVGR